MRQRVAQLLQLIQVIPSKDYELSVAGPNPGLA